MDWKHKSGHKRNASHPETPRTHCNRGWRNQARADNINVFELVDTLKKLTEIQLSQVVAQVLNAYREKISLLGYRTAPIADNYESRNILV